MSRGDAQHLTVFSADRTIESSEAKTTLTMRQSAVLSTPEGWYIIRGDNRKAYSVSLPNRAFYFIALIRIQLPSPYEGEGSGGEVS